MPYDGSIREELEGCFEAKEPGWRERADAWAMANGLQKVDGLTPSRYLAASFGNLLLGEQNELKSRYLQIGVGRPPPRFGGNAARKGCQKTVERVSQLVKENPRITQAGLVAELNITRSAVQKHLANLKASGRVRRIGPDKGGRWEVC